eukprot:8674573-Alexandrium_andersonii.AAC.1
MQNSLRRSKLELCGSRSGLRIGPRSSRGVRSAPLFALIPKLVTEMIVLQVPKGVPRGSRGVPRGFRGGSEW